MKSTGFILCIITTFILNTSCSNTQDIQIRQGIAGKVIWLEGNLMPGPGKKPAEGIPIEREILIYEATKGPEFSNPPFYTDLSATLVATARSDENGSFSMKLSPGTYSVMVKEERGLFASIMDGNGILNPVTVKNNEVTEILIKVDYKAAYKYQILH